jgi:hypothetical protein
MVRKAKFEPRMMPDWAAANVLLLWRDCGLYDFREQICVKEAMAGERSGVARLRRLTVWTPWLSAYGRRCDPALALGIRPMELLRAFALRNNASRSGLTAALPLRRLLRRP